MVALYVDGRVLVPFGSYAGQNSGIPIPPLTDPEFRRTADALFGFAGHELQARTAPGWLTAERVRPLLDFCTRVADAYAASPEPATDQIIRHSYHSTDYTKLTHAMFDAWARVARESGAALVHQMGGLDLVRECTPQVEEFNNYRASLAAIDIEWEELDATQIRTRWPQFAIEDEWSACSSRRAGCWTSARPTPPGVERDLVRPGGHLNLARRAGAEVRDRTKVVRLDPRDDVVEVHTEDEVLLADHVVVCTASWLEHLMPGLGLD